MYKIGEFSMLSKTTIKALRYYEEQGLIKPCFVDKYTNYRYYETSQLEEVARIVFLREIGLSIKEIRDIIGGADLLKSLENRKQSVCNEIALCQNQLQKINKALEEQQMEQKIIIKSIPSYTVYYKEGVINNFSEIASFVFAAGQECGAHNPMLKCCQPGYCFVEYLDGEYRESNVAIRYSEAVESVGVESETIKFAQIPAVKCVCIQHKGAYEELRSSYNAILKYIEQNGLKMAALPRECYIDGCWNKENVEDYLTEIQIPVE